ncbi:MAG TPA: hypothetical protein VH331_02470 [Allosphingosinicella sp.]|nr:hypothetical protein [Allosphingosinicella sp.]
MPARAEAMGGGKPKDETKPAPPPDGAEGHNSLEDAAEDAVQELEKQRDGKGYAGFGDIG